MIKRPQNIARKLRVIRAHLGVSQTGMKRLLNFKSPYTRISEYERGKRQPTILTLLAYARVAGVPLEQLVDDAMELNFEQQAGRDYVREHNTGPSQQPSHKKGSRP